MKNLLPRGFPLVCLLFLLLFKVGTTRSQVPAQNALLHYTQIYFEENFTDQARRYELNVYEDSLRTKSKGNKTNHLPAFNLSGFEWGKTYWWCVNAYDKNDRPLIQGTLHKFAIRRKIHSVNVIDTRVDVKVNKKGKNAGGLILLDYARGIFDRDGNQVWAVPDLEGFMNERKQIRDLNVTYDHTITFLGGNVPIEIDFEGRVLWKAPSPFILGTDTITYHHDFKKLKNGHYYVLGNKKVARKVTGNYAEVASDNDHTIFKVGDTLYKKTLHGLLMEFDAKGKLVWYWDSNEYVSDEDLNYRKNDKGLPTFGTHMNAFSINTALTKAYIGFRDLNRIVKLDLKTKKVEFSYGEKYPSGDAKVGDKLFRGQHDAGITNRGTLLVLDNNNDQKGEVGEASVIEIKETVKPNENPLVWKFKLHFDTLTDGKSAAAGNVNELQNGNLLVCGGGLPRIMEVNKTKELVWDAFIYGMAEADSSWSKFPQYRCHYTPQLYHYHFLSRTQQQPGAVKGMANVKVELYNTGNAKDSYLISIVDQQNQTLVSQKSASLPAGGSASLIIAVKRDANSAQEVFVNVTSTNNPPLTRTTALGLK